jgi:hypothetical protein
VSIDPGIPVLGFAVLGIAAAVTRAPIRRRALLNLFIAYTLVVSFGAGFSQREVWPFSAWPLVAGKVPTPVTQPRIVAVDATGREHDIDHRAWGPLVFQELLGWEEKSFMRLDPEARARAAAYLLRTVEESRAAFAAGEPALRNRRFLGPLAAPYFLGHPDRWIPGGPVPAGPFVGLRFYRESWDVEERLLDPARVQRTLAYEYHVP